MYPHPGKFEGELYATKYAYESALDGCSEELGESETFGWYGAFSGKIKGRGPFHIIVSENSQGFVSGTYYGTAEELTAAWTALESEYEDYCTNEDEDGEYEGEDGEYEIAETVSGRFMVKRNGFQIGGSVDTSGAGNREFDTREEAQALINQDKAQS